LRRHRCGGGKGHFIHAQLRIHTGRSVEQKRRLSDAVLATLQRQQWPAKDITVEVVEMARESYAKFSSE
jgi:5-carboxymethyl-2-hydroxymuconate isomerase